MRWSARFAARTRAAALALAALAVTGAVCAPALFTPAGAATGPADWPAFLNGPAHASDNAGQTAITPANAGALTRQWHFVGDQPTMPGQPKPAYNASPTVADGAVFIGSRTGWFYKLDERTGTVLAKTFLGFQPGHTCTAGGIVSTATVATDPSDGQDTVYVGSPDGYLYALRATDLSRKWRSVIAIPSAKVSDYFQWSSPTVTAGKIYIGVSSHCDDPLVRGGLIAYNQASGKVLAHYYSVPKGVIGGSVWSSAAASSRYVYVSTGNGTPSARRLYDTISVVELRAGTLVRVARFQPPASQRLFDADFGASPALFGSLVGACDKNGLFYALHVPSMTLAWERRARDEPGRDGQCPVHRVVSVRRQVPVRRRDCDGDCGTPLRGLRPPPRSGDRRGALADRPAEWRDRRPDPGRRRRARGRHLRQGLHAERGVPAQRANWPDPAHGDQRQHRLRAERVRRRLAIYRQRHRRLRLGPARYGSPLTGAGWRIRSELNRIRQPAVPRFSGPRAYQLATSPAFARARTADGLPEWPTTAPCSGHIGQARTAPVRFPAVPARQPDSRTKVASCSANGEPTRS